VTGNPTLASGSSTSGAPPRVAARATRFVLPNGLTLIVRENHANPTIALQGAVKAGAIFDPAGKSGLGAFVAAMLDQGTRTSTAFEQASKVESLGASLRFEGGLETVSVSANLLSEDLDAILAAMADALRNPVFPAEEIEKIRDELITEIRIAENSTASVASRRANELLYPETHPYHFHPGGTEPSITGITREDLAAFHARQYGPGSLVLVLVGDLTPEQASRSVTAALGDWAPLASAPEFRVPSSPAPTGTRRVDVSKPGKSQADVVCAMPGLARTAANYDAAMMMNYVLGGGSLSSRLMDTLRDREGLVYGVYSSLIGGIGAGPIQIRAGTNPKNAERAVNAILEQVTLLRDAGPTEEEMDAAKGFLTGVFPVRLETNTGVAHQLVSAELYGLGLDYIDRYPGIIRGVTAEHVAAAARQYLRPDTCVLVVAGDLGGSGS